MCNLVAKRVIHMLNQRKIIYKFSSVSPSRNKIFEGE
jgi:hypothetical protein